MRHNTSLNKTQTLYIRSSNNNRQELKSTNILKRSRQTMIGILQKKREKIPLCRQKNAHLFENMTKYLYEN